MANKKYDLEDRLVEFAANLIFFCAKLPKDMAGQYYGNRLLRSSGSAALNFGEAQGTNTDRDDVNKAGITLKELKESRVSIKILTKVNYGNDSKRVELLGEAEQVIRIIATIIKNKK